MVVFFAWGDTKARYRRSVLGPWWMVLSTAVSVAGLGFLWSLILKDDPEKLVPSLTVGLVVWQFLAGCITESSSCLYRSAHFIRNIRVPFFVFPFQLLVRQSINLGHNAVIICLVVLYFGIPASVNLLLIIPGLVLVILNLAWICMLLAILGARFRDVEQIVNALMPLMFFLSPVIYRPSQLPQAQEIVWMNPFSYLITLVRDPVMGSAPPLFVYGVSFLVLLLGWFFTLYVLGKSRRYISFWV